MMELRRGEERGHANHGWLDSFHSFSFADYYDPQHMGFGPLRVINEDRVNPGAGFGTHAHRDMEILTYVLEGELAHRDSMGNGSVIRPGSVQRMSAGSGVRHSEFNHSQEDAVHFLQIWIEPNVQGIAPGYEEKHFDAMERRGSLRLIASPGGEDGAVQIHQDAKIYAGLFDGDEGVRELARPARRIYLHVARGEIRANGHVLRAGDALKLQDENGLELSHGKGAEVLLFDLP